MNLAAHARRWARPLRCDKRHREAARLAPRCLSHSVWRRQWSSAPRSSARPTRAERTSGNRRWPHRPAGHTPKGLQRQGRGPGEEETHTTERRGEALLWSSAQYRLSPLRMCFERGTALRRNFEPPDAREEDGMRCRFRQVSRPRRPASVKLLDDPRNAKDETPWSPQVPATGSLPAPGAALSISLFSIRLILSDILYLIDAAFCIFR
jgi:hypothetical protein